MNNFTYLPKVNGTYREKVILANTTWFGVGGVADILYRPSDVEDLRYFLQNRPKDINITILGLGSNLLVRDGGIRGVVIKLGNGFNNIEHNEDVLTVGTAVSDLNLSKYCLENEIAGFEFYSGIPGCIGGALAMNAGAYGGETSNLLIKATAIDLDGNIIELENKDFGFHYRGNSLKENLIFVDACFKSTKGSRIEIEKKIKQINIDREASQPIKSRTSGSTFKNLDGMKAWQLIDEAGCRGLRIGDAMMSEKHCNFMLNLGNATATDLENLGNEVIARVEQKFHLKLEWEIKIIGDRL